MASPSMSANRSWVDWLLDKVTTLETRIISSSSVCEIIV